MGIDPYKGSIYVFGGGSLTLPHICFFDYFKVLKNRRVGEGFTPPTTVDINRSTIVGCKGGVNPSPTAQQNDII